MDPRLRGGEFRAPWIWTFLSGNDCNDSNANVYPTNPNTNCDCVAPIPQGTTEVCSDGQDNDCDGAIDAADPERGGGTCAGTAAASAHAAPGEREGGLIGLLAFLLIPVAASSGLVFARRRRWKTGRTILFYPKRPRPSSEAAFFLCDS